MKLEHAIFDLGQIRTGALNYVGLCQVCQSNICVRVADCSGQPKERGAPQEAVSKTCCLIVNSG
jgi:hypothetical protein